jgi:hypothetical protein
MVLAHGRALAAAWQSLLETGFDLEPLIGGVALTLSMLFFSLKVLDAAWLRFKPGRRSLIAFCMVVALVHLDVIRANDNPTLMPEYAALVATTCIAGTVPTVRRAVRGVFARAGSAFRYRPTVRPSSDTVWMDLFRPRCWILAFRFYNLRAPPA